MINLFEIFVTANFKCTRETVFLNRQWNRKEETYKAGVSKLKQRNPNI